MIVYSAKTSLNGCVNDQERSVSTPLRTPAIRGDAVRETLDDDEPITKEYVQIWRAADKVVFRER